MNRDQQVAKIAENKGIMGLMDISRSGMVAQSEKMRIMAELVANMDVVYEQGKFNNKRVTFQETLDKAVNGKGEIRGGVTAKIEEDQTQVERFYDPANPYADKEGFVYSPKISFSQTI
ncbi:MAG: hypothetical protein WC838_05820, partial [Candidatus Margulisiibacteriota bacterium]